MTFDPLFVLSLIFLQISNKYMQIPITKAQQKIIQHPITQIGMFAIIVYFSTKNVLLTAFIVIMFYILLNILLNENHKLNILPKQWLYKQHIINEPIISYKEVYKNNIEKYHL